jgi:hypothetical protein
MVSSLEVPCTCVFSCPCACAWCSCSWQSSHLAGNGDTCGVRSRTTTGHSAVCVSVYVLCWCEPAVLLLLWTCWQGLPCHGQLPLPLLLYDQWGWGPACIPCQGGVRPHDHTTTNSRTTWQQKQQQQGRWRSVAHGRCAAVNRDKDAYLHLLPNVLMTLLPGQHTWHSSHCPALSHTLLTAAAPCLSLSCDPARSCAGCWCAVQLQRWCRVLCTWHR